MNEEAAELFVAELVRSCNIPRATVYRHADIFSKLNFYREQQLQAKIRS